MMPLPIPNLDDRTFNDLLQEAKTLIPIFNKEWTNHNPSDPGITLLELFAWLSEMTIYRINQVPEANYREFLKLIGVDYLFHWDGIPGMDNIRVTDFLGKNYGITWVQPVSIEKSPDDRTILISDQKNSASLSLDNEKNQITIRFLSGVTDMLEVKPEPLFKWDNIPGTDETRLLQFMNVTFDMAVTSQIEKNAEGTMIYVSDAGKIVSFALNQNKDHVSITSYDGQKSQLPVKKVNGRLQIVRLKIFEPIAKDIQRGLSSLKKRYRAVTADDFQALTLEALSQLQPGLDGRVISVMNRDLEYSKSDPYLDKPGHVSVMLLVSGEKPVFCWDEIPGRDNTKLNDFLTRVYDIHWLAAANITKSPDGNQITVSKAEVSETVVITKTDDGKAILAGSGFSDELLIKKEPDDKNNEKQNIYAYGIGNAKPSVLLKRLIKQFLSRRKLVTTRIHVLEPMFYPVTLKAEIVLSANTNPETVKQAAKTRVNQFLSPLDGGDDGNGWPLGRNVHKSEIYNLLERVPGVDHVSGLRLDGTDSNQVALQPHQLIDPEKSQIIIEVSP